MGDRVISCCIVSRKRIARLVRIVRIVKVRLAKATRARCDAMDAMDATRCDRSMANPLYRSLRQGRKRLVMTRAAQQQSAEASTRLDLDVGFDLDLGCRCAINK